MDAGESEVPPGAEIIEIDAAQLEQLLVLGDGAAEFVDQHGNTIRLTAEELIEAGFTADSLEEPSLARMGEVSAYGDTSGGEYYVIGSGDHEPPRLELAAEPLSAGTMNESGSTEESQSDKPPVLSASVPLGPGGRCVPSDPQDVKELRALYEEYCKELKEKEGKLETDLNEVKRLEERTLLMANALVKNVSWEEAEVFLDAHDTPGNMTAATVSVKRARADENPPEDAVLVHLDSGETCFVIAQDLSGQSRTMHSGTTDIDKRSSLLCCDRCPRRFLLESELVRHRETAHPRRIPFECRFCNKQLLFISESDFKAHVRIFHRKQTADEADTLSTKPEEEKEPEWELLEVGKRNETLAETDRVQGGEHKCTICFKDFPTYFSAGRHVKEDHMITDEQRLLTLVVPSRSVDFVMSKCDVCERTYSKPEFLERHKIAHTDAIPYACKLCPRRFKWQENLQKHMTTHGSRANFKCPECNQVFYSQTRTRHSGRQREQMCPLCDCAFYEKECLAKHMRSHGGTLFACNECDKKFTDKQFLIRHMGVHTGVKKYVCEVCGKNFSTVEHLAAHRHVHEERKFACEKCDFRFTSKEALREHWKWHSARFKAVCKKCTVRFVTKEELEEHVKSAHRRCKPLICGICKKTFWKLQSLKAHVDKHRQISTFPCPKCDRTFSKQDALSRHMRLHAGVKAHRCSHCTQSFNRKDEIFGHMRSHFKHPSTHIVVAAKHSGVIETTIVRDSKKEDEETSAEHGQMNVNGLEFHSRPEKAMLEQQPNDLFFIDFADPHNVIDSSTGRGNGNPMQMVCEGMPLLPEQLVDQETIYMGADSAGIVQPDVGPMDI
ncbi:hypothetical protein M513_03447 [Trichuris suis]|uniref:C2H2-type domain-containing protein n=2 Tax=Trichuris suis TaxID=68888 RepID=A0A085MEQ3_9BILA|nr:hypothetical protein M513_03447 [Trichuris suis]